MSKGARLEKLNWDKECELDFLMGRGFEIYDTILRDDQKCLHGIQSPIFCSDWGDENAFEERYTCKCGAYRGKIFEGETCPNCREKIEFKDVDLSITGWIKINDYKIIQPIYYNKLLSIIGQKAFPEIIQFGKRVGKNGKIESVVQEKPSSPFMGIGLIEFRERFDEILDYYKTKKKNKIMEIEEIEEDKEKVFASAIPVYSSVLRPMS